MKPINCRWVHIDLKSQTPKLESLLEQAVHLAEEGITGLLIEWENIFPYRSVAEAVSADAYSPEEVRLLLDTCRQLGLTAVPLVQTFGHLEWLLSQPAYADLREFPARSDQIRAGNGSRCKSPQTYRWCYHGKQPKVEDEEMSGHGWYPKLRQSRGHEYRQKDVYRSSGHAHAQNDADRCR